MNIPVPALILSIAALVAGGVMAAPPTADQMRAILKARPEADEIRWKDPSRGAPLKVRILSASDKGVVVEKQLATGLTVRTVPLGDLAGIVFAAGAVELELLKNPSTAAAGALGVLWEARRVTVPFAGSNASATGLALARSLRMSGTASSLEEAGKILDYIRYQDPDVARKNLARAEQETLDFVRSLAKGNLEETDKLAWSITSAASDENADAMLLATDFLADRHFSLLKSIEEENPRWVEDDEVRPLRERYYHLALDFSLYPSLFQAGRATEAAAGLAKAAAVYEFTGQASPLKGVLEDLAALYPASPQAKAAAPLLERLRKAEAEGKAAELSKASPGKPDAESSDEPPATPPPPKRYDLFGE